MLGFKRFANTSTVITGIELVQKLRKGQFHVALIHKFVAGKKWVTRGEDHE